MHDPGTPWIDRIAGRLVKNDEMRATPWAWRVLKNEATTVAAMTEDEA